MVKITDKQRAAAYRYWDSYIPLSDEVVHQYHQVTTYGQPLDYTQVPSYDWHILEDLLSNHRAWPWIMEQERKYHHTTKKDIERIVRLECKQKWLDFLNNG